MNVTKENLIRFNRALRPGMAAAYAAALSAVLGLAEIEDKPRRMCHFMAQLAHESAGFAGLTESLNYRSPELLEKLFHNVQTLAHARQLIRDGQVAIGNCVYANKLGNGDVASGDGYRFRGRGFIMITGRANYAEVRRYTDLDVVEQPDLLSTTDTAARAAALFWKTRKINFAADEDDIVEVTRLVNGKALQGLDKRRARYEVAKTIWP